MQLEEGKIVEIEELEGTAVINAIKNVDNEIANHEATIEALKNVKEEIKTSHPLAIYEHDLQVISSTLEVFYTIIRTDYTEFDEAELYLNGLFHQIATKIEEHEEEPSVNEVEEPVEAEA